MHGSSRQLLIFLLFAGIGILLAHPYFEGTRNANERPRLVQLLAIADSGELRINGPARRGLSLGPDISRNPHTGDLYPNKPPGASFVGLPAVYLSRLGSEQTTLSELTWWARLLSGALPALGIIALFLAWTRPPLRSSALLASLIFLFATPTASYSRLFYGHLLAGLFFFGGSLLVIRGIQFRRWKEALMGGACCGMAVTVEYGIAFAGLPLALFAIGSGVRKAPRELLASMGGFMLPAIGLLWYHSVAFGSPFETGYHHVINPEFIEKHGQGFLGLSTPRWESFYTHFLSPKSGLFALAPVVLLGLFGLVQEARSGENRTVARIFLGMMAMMVLVGSSLRFDGGWRVGPRYLVSTLPVLLLGWRNWFARSHNPFVLTGAFTLVLLSLAVNHSIALLWPHLNVDPIAWPWGDVVVPLLQADCLSGVVYGLDSAVGYVALLLPLCAALRSGNSARSHLPLASGCRWSVLRCAFVFHAFLERYNGGPEPSIYSANAQLWRDPSNEFVRHSCASPIGAGESAMKIA